MGPPPCPQTLPPARGSCCSSKWLHRLWAVRKAGCGATVPFLCSLHRELLQMTVFTRKEAPESSSAAQQELWMLLN